MSNYIKKEMKYKKVGEGYLFENGIGLNETSFRIYELCEKESNKDFIIEQLQKEYKVDHIEKEVFISEIKDCIDSMKEVGLIEEI